MNIQHISKYALASLMVAVSIAACSGTSSQVNTEKGAEVRRSIDVSRVKLYSSTRALASDSSAVVVGTVSAQRVVADITPDIDFTVSTLTVVEVGKSTTGLAVGDSIEVRQLGSADAPPPSTLMSVGGGYLLFLTSSGLDGDLATQFYITGGNAGLYAADAQATAARIGVPAFSKVDLEPGENLPQRLTASESLG